MSAIDNDNGETDKSHLPEHGGVVDNLAELQRMLAAPDLARQYRPIGVSKAMESVIHEAERFAHSSATILLTGESGTGKEVVARWIHHCSRRAERPYVRVNCAALPETLFESELFGHERGSFTGATQERRGRIAAAEDGTLLLDEISEIPIGMQVKLLRVLEEEEFQRVGSDEDHQVRARVIATSNRALDEEVSEGRFREDLYYRLNVLRIAIPALRERPTDIPALANHFLQRFKHESTIPLRGFSNEAMKRLQRYTWPGNIRQLSNVVQRACILATESHLSWQDLGELSNSPTVDNVATDLDTMTLEQIEQHFILKSLAKHQGNKTAAARALAVTSRTLSNKLARYASEGPARAA